MLALEMPAGMSQEETGRFIVYFIDIARYLIKEDFNILGDEVLSKVIEYFGLDLSTKLVNHMRNNDLESGVIETMYVIGEYLYTENMFKYTLDRHKKDMREGIFVQAIKASLKEWHKEMRFLSMAKASYEDGYQATMRFVKEYAIQQPAAGRA